MRINPIDQLSAKGSTFTFEEAKEVLGADASVARVIISRLEKKGWIERIEKGKYLIIPLGAESGKYTVHEFVVGSMLIKPCFVSYWSALQFHGLTEQIPSRVFLQSPTRRGEQKVSVFGVSYKIVRITPRKFFGAKTEWIEETAINITDREKTIIDCLDKPQNCGGVIEVAKALNRTDLDEVKVNEYLTRFSSSAVIRRLGFLLDLLGKPITLPPIDTRNYVKLDPTMPDTSSRNAKWRLLVNLDDNTLGSLE